MSKAHRVGRPYKDGKAKRTNRTVRLSQTAWQQVDAVARAASIPKSEAMDRLLTRPVSYEEWLELTVKAEGREG